MTLQDIVTFKLERNIKLKKNVGYTRINKVSYEIILTRVMINIT